MCAVEIFSLTSTMVSRLVLCLADAEALTKELTSSAFISREKTVLQSPLSEKIKVNVVCPQISLLQTRKLCVHT